MAAAVLYSRSTPIDQKWYMAVLRLQDTAMCPLSSSLHVRRTAQIATGHHLSCVTTLSDVQHMHFKGLSYSLLRLKSVGWQHLRPMS